MVTTVEEIPDLKIIEPSVFQDGRGYFFESYNKLTLKKCGIEDDFVQDNESKSTKGVLRGMHYQTGSYAQSKLVRVTVGEVYDVAVDMREDSPSFGKWFGLYLSAENKKQFYIPKGFAHGFLVTSELAVFNYKCDNYYNKESEGGFIYNDIEIKITWPELEVPFLVSEKDSVLPQFKNAIKF